MSQVGFVLFLLTAPLFEGGSPAHQQSRQPERVKLDPCAAAERIAAQPPCLRAEDCGALRSWERLFGAPGVEPLEPRLAVRVSRRDPPASYLCLAAAAPRAQRLPPR